MPIISDGNNQIGDDVSDKHTVLGVTQHTGSYHISGSTGNYLLVGSDDMTVTMSVAPGGASTSVTPHVGIFEDRQGIPPAVVLTSGDNTKSYGGQYILARQSSTGSVGIGDVLGSIVSMGHDGTDYNAAAEIRFSIDGNVTTDVMPSKIEFMTNAGSNTTVFPTTRMTVGSDGKVGIGTATPDYTLDVAGDIGVDQKIYHNGDANTYINFTDDRIRFEAGGLNLFGMHKKDSAPHQVTVNNGNNNVDFVVNTNDANTSPLLRCDASAGKVGIGTASPTEILTLNATDPTIRFEEGGTLKATMGVNSSDNILIENKTINKHIVFKVNDQGVVREGFRLDGAVPEVVVNQTSDSLVDFRVESDSQTHMLFVSGGSDRVGIKTDSPDCELHVNGDVKITGITNYDVQSVDLGSGTSGTITPNSSMVFLDCDSIAAAAEGFFSASVATSGFSNGDTVRLVITTDVAHPIMFTAGLLHDASKMFGIPSSSTKGSSFTLVYVSAVSKWAVLSMNGLGGFA